MGRRALLCFVLLVGLLVGITLEPDSGTAASLGHPDVTGSTVGANHAKPLPRITTVDQVARTASLSFLAGLVLVVVAQIATARRASDHDGTGAGRSLLWARVPTRRGPPAPFAG